MKWGFLLSVLARSLCNYFPFKKYKLTFKSVTEIQKECKEVY